MAACCCSVTKLCPTLPHGLQHARLPCPSPSPRVCSDSCPLRRWCHPTISSPVVPFSSHLQSFPASGSFLMSQLFTSGGQSIRASASVLPMNIQDWFPLGFTGFISLLSKGLSRVFSSITVQKHQFFSAQPSLWFNSHIYTWLLGKKPHSFDFMDLCWQSVKVFYPRDIYSLIGTCSCVYDVYPATTQKSPTHTKLPCVGICFLLLLLVYLVEKSCIFCVCEK